MTKPIYKYSDTGIEKDGHAMFPQDVCKDIQYFQREVAKLAASLEQKKGQTNGSTRNYNKP